MTAVRDVVVLGAGLTGLAVAQALRRRGADVLVLEEREEAGGNIRTLEAETREGSWLIDLGPQAFGDAQPALGELVRESKAEDQLVRAEGYPDRRFLWLDGKLQEVPTSPTEFLASPVLPLSARMRVMREPFIPALPAGAPEETLAQFCDRRFGETVRRRILTPVIGGICAGDPERLGAESSFPKMVALEREYGSLLNAASRGAGPPSRGRFMSFSAGMQELPAAIALRMSDAIRTESPVGRITQEHGAWHVRLVSGEDVVAQRVVVTLPAHRAADVVSDAAPAAAQFLRDIHYAPVAVAHVGVPDTGLHGVPPGFGFLVPRDEGLRILGCIFSSQLFPNRAPGGHSLFTVFAGGDLDPDALALDDETIRDTVVGDLGRAFGCRLDAALFVVTRWQRAIPQYVVGHAAHVARIDGAVPPGLHLLGNWRGGISMEDCAREAAAFAAGLAL